MPKPLPYKVRLFNRILLITLATLMVVQCVRCSFFKNESAAPTAQELEAQKMGEAEAEDDDTLPQREGIDSADALDEHADLTHVFLQKDTCLAHQMDIMLRRYHPDNALFLAVDAKTDEILAWGERKEGAVQTAPDYLTRATFPAASLAKTVTVAAALEARKYNLNSEIPMIGGGHTLYLRQVRPRFPYGGETITLADAYAKSYNPPVAIVGISVGPKKLKAVAEKFGFNKSYPQGVPQRSSYAPPDTGYELAETACGFTRKTTLSPLQAAGISRAIVTGKAFELPWSSDHALGYAPIAPIRLPGTEFSKATYQGLRDAMLHTVLKGTARKHISTRNISRAIFDRLDIGGKTGSLDGEDPKGRYDWFMGFAQDKNDPQNAVVIVVMQAHGAIRSQPSTQVAAILINYWAKEHLSDKN